VRIWSTIRRWALAAEGDQALLFRVRGCENRVARPASRAGRVEVGASELVTAKTLNSFSLERLPAASCSTCRGSAPSDRRIQHLLSARAARISLNGRAARARRTGETRERDSTTPASRGPKLGAPR